MTIFGTSGIEAFVTENNLKYSNRIIKQLKVFKKTNGLDDFSLPMKREGSKTHLRCGLPTMKFVCPKMKWIWNNETKKSKRVCFCENPCTQSSCGQIFHIYPDKLLRAYPGTARGTNEWNSSYKTRVTVEKSINHFKDSFTF